MKTFCKALAASFGALAVGLLLVPSATAQCGFYQRPAATHASWDGHGDQVRLVRAGLFADDDETATVVDDNSIVGFWHVKFISEGTKGIPDGTEIDAGYAQWHSDGTEIMNSAGRSPITGDFCLGVWQKLGNLKYILNHFAAAWDATGANLIGPGNIRESITLDPDGAHFSGTFTIDQYTEAGKRLAHVQGNITAKRIYPGSVPESIF
jgi:hypothetical protein